MLPLWYSSLLNHANMPFFLRCSWVSGLECDSTWHTLPNGTWVPYSEVTAVDDAAMLVDEFEAFLLGAVQADRPFLAQISFHQVREYTRHAVFYVFPSARCVRACYGCIWRLTIMCSFTATRAGAHPVHRLYVCPYFFH